jgi:hypothetical protein
MVGALIVSIVLAVLCSAGMAFAWCGYISMKAKCEDAYAIGRDQATLIKSLRGELSSLRYGVAYDMGLEDGRTTDEVYKALIRRKQKGKPFTVLVGGSDKEPIGRHAVGERGYNR